MTTLEPIAIVGYACKLPGDVSSPEDLWELCSRGRTGWGPTPSTRYSKDAYYHPAPGKHGCINTEGGYFLHEDPARFDAPFFNMTVQEATALDPQQRLLLECTFEAFESSGMTKEGVAGKDIGVFVGGSFADYEVNNTRDIDTAPTYQATGCAPAMQSNRLSYYFDLRGPSMTVDTACSSSLVALHSAMQSLRNGESSSAVVAAAHLNLTPDFFVTMSNTQLLNDAGKTFAFDHRAISGFARGEGAGSIVLKPLNAAVRDGDVIRAVIHNSGVNQDGKTNGITVPNGRAQSDLIKQVYAKAGLDPAECGFSECHGTGTKVGDPIEVAGIHEALGAGRSPRSPLFIGSVKSNVGHLEGASGIVSYVSVSNYGFGGANAHVVLGAAPKGLKTTMTTVASLDEAPKDPLCKLFVLSAHDSQALQKKITDLGIFLEQRPEVFEKLLAGNVAYTLGERRSHLPCRIAIAAVSSDELGQSLATAKVPTFRARNEPTLGFVFTGQGAQWAAMGAELIRDYPIFEAALDKADDTLRGLGADFSLKEEMMKPAEQSLINAAHISQPACTALQIALTMLLSSWGIHPAAVVGHSSGEIGCAFAAGIIGLEDAMKIAYFRGQCMLSLKKKAAGRPQGTMMAVGTSAENVRQYLDTVTRGYVTIACINSPSSVTLSGDVEAVEELQPILTEKSIFNRQLKVGVAYHSAHLEPVAGEYLDLIKDIHPSTTATATFYSSLLGRVAEPSELTPDYWVQNLTSPVRFSDALSAMANQTGSKVIDHLVELGPHSALQGPIRDTLATIDAAKGKLQYVSVLARNQNASECALRMAGALYMKGLPLTFGEINFPRTKSTNQKLITDLPRYPFNHDTRYWHESRLSQKHCFKEGGRNDILGTLADWSNDLEPTWRNIVRLDDLPFLRGHKMQSMPVFPMAGYMGMALEAAARRASARGVQFDRFEIREFVVSSALVLNEDTDVEMTITLKPYSEGLRGAASDLWDDFKICSWDSKRGWLQHCHGLVGVRTSPAINGVDAHKAGSASKAFELRKSDIISASTDSVDTEAMYETLTAVGAEYGPVFTGLKPCQASDKTAHAQLIVPDTKSLMPKGYETELIVHPALLDQIIQIVWPIFGAGRQGLDTLYMPTFVKNFSISRNFSAVPGSQLEVFGSGSPNREAPEPTKFGFFVVDPASADQPLMQFDGLTMTPLRESSTSSGAQARELCYKIDWQVVSDEEATLDNSTSDISDTPIKTDSLVSTPFMRDEAVCVIYNETGEKDFASEIADSIWKTSGTQAALVALSKASVTDKKVIFVSTSKNLLGNIDAPTFDSLRQMLLSAGKVLWVYKEGPNDADVEGSMVVGFTRAIRSETSADIITLGLQNATNKTIVDNIFAVLSKTGSDSTSSFKDDKEFILKGDNLMIPRVVDDEELNTRLHQESQDSVVYQQPFAQLDRRLKMVIATLGSLDSFYFVDDEPKPLGDNEVEIEVKATGMNFKDVVVSMGQLSQPYIGVECAGVIAAVGKNVTDVKVGQSVMAMTEGAYSTYARCLSTSVAPLPERMDFTAASTIPVVFCTAYYGLFDLGRLTEGESVLIHAAAGGVGQAAIMLAQTRGAEIFATVGSIDKKQHIMEEYGIAEDHIFYSRDTTFGPAIRQATGGQGVDIVLNSLGGDFLRESWDCLAPFGRFIEIGKADITKNSRLEMAQFEYNVSFASVDLTKVAAYRPKLMKRLLNDVEKLMSNGSIRPVGPVTSYGINEVEAAFRSLQSGKSMGKLVITPQHGDLVQAVSPKKTASLFKEDASYLIIGGTGGLGCSIARWMASRGAKLICLSSRRANITPRLEELISDLAQQGTKILVRACDVANLSSVETLIQNLQKEAPVRGVIQGAMVLKDVLYEQMTTDDFNAVVNPKVAGTLNLHNTLESSELDFFIALSSVAGVVGNRGQAAYAAANVFLDTFMAHRNAQGLPGTSLDLTAVSDVGYLADNSERAADVLRNLGGETIEESEILGLLTAAVTGKITASNNHVITGLKIQPGSEPFWSHDAKFSNLLAAAVSQTSQEGGNANVPLPQALKTAGSSDKALEVLYAALVTKLAAVLMLSVEEMEPSAAVASYSLDSLAAIEVRNWIAREADANVQVLELLTSPSLMELAKLILKKSKLVSFE
ncbi:polyketide synthase [Aureobasidium pullulans]|uniref:Polyketide synthase n=1 Tax=Aureobasidium pullulans TaxID=5580 RepID=A0A4S9KX40_AURPU|nr:polyketide synthase [Aureobasidium pullulans]